MKCYLVNSWPLSPHLLTELGHLLASHALVRLVLQPDYLLTLEVVPEARLNMMLG